MKYRIARNLGKNLLEKLGKVPADQLVEGKIVDLSTKEAEILGSNVEPLETKKPETKPEPKPEVKK